jgi:phage tail-like protein
MSSSQRKDKYKDFNFQVEVGGSIIAGFSKLSISDSTSNPSEQGVDADPASLRKLPALIKHGTLTLKSGIGDKTDFFNWHKQVRQDDARKKIAIMLTDKKRNMVSRWELSHTLPTKYKSPDLNAEGNDIAIETWEIRFETMQRTE